MIQHLNEMPLSKYGSHCYYGCVFEGICGHVQVTSSFTLFGGSCAPGSIILTWFGDFLCISEALVNLRPNETIDGMTECVWLYRIKRH